MTESIETARTFSKVNPAGGTPSVVSSTLPDAVVQSLVERGVLRFDSPTGAWQVVDWDAFNQVAKFTKLE